MAPLTTRTGIQALDSAFGGLYLQRPTLVSGRRKTGKFIFAIQLLAKVLKSGDSAVFFTGKDPAEVVAALAARGVDTDLALESSQLIICPYSSMQRSGEGIFAPLPFPQAAEELVALVSDHSISYAIFDTIVPWTAIEPLEEMPAHVEAFVKSLEKMGLTSLLLIPAPASPAAQSLANLLRELCPTNIELESKNFGAEFVMRVTKYQGATGAPLPWEKTLDLIPGVGFGVAEESGPAASAPPAPPSFSNKPLQTRHFRPLVSPGSPATLATPQPDAAKPASWAGQPGGGQAAAPRKFRPFVQAAPNGGFAIPPAPVAAAPKAAFPARPQVFAPHQPQALPRAPHQPRTSSRIPLPQPPQAINQSAQASNPAQARQPSRPAAAGAAGAARKPLFSSIIDLPGIPAQPESISQPALHEVKDDETATRPSNRKPSPGSRHVSFSSVID